MGPLLIRRGNALRLATFPSMVGKGGVHTTAVQRPVHQSCKNPGLSSAVALSKWRGAQDWEINIETAS